MRVCAARSPDQRDWKNALTLSEVTGGGQEGRLPVILEDKCYPRRTMKWVYQLSTKYIARSGLII